MNNDVKELISQQPQELEVVFPLIKELFNEGEKTFGGIHNGSASDYYRSEDRTKVPKLPNKFAALVPGSNPDNYYLTYYEDRRDPYFSKDSRERSVCIATQPSKTSSNKPLREIIFIEKDNVFYMTIAENVNNRAFLEWEQANQEGLVQPSGRMKAKYKLDAGRRILIDFTASRLDEVVFDKAPGRWTRSLSINPQSTEYSELLILNRSNDIRQEKRVNVVFQVNGLLEHPDSVTITFGYGPQNSAKTIAEAHDGKVKVLVHDDSKEGLDILRTDPSYNFLNDTELDGEKVLSFIRDRIELLQQQWDKPQSVFEGNPQLESSNN